MSSLGTLTATRRAGGTEQPSVISPIGLGQHHPVAAGRDGRGARHLLSLVRRRRWIVAPDPVLEGVADEGTVDVEGADRHAGLRATGPALLESLIDDDRSGPAVALMALILVVDDEREIRALLQEALEQAGHQVLTASDGREAVRVFQEHRPVLVITDIVMPRRSGIDLVLELSRAVPPPKMIAMSGVTGPRFLEASRETNVARTFVKPFDVREVIRAVADLTA